MNRFWERVAFAGRCFFSILFRADIPNDIAQKLVKLAGPVPQAATAAAPSASTPGTKNIRVAASRSAGPSLIEVSHHGARLGCIAFHPKAGEVVHLVSGGGDARFRVIWVGQLGTPQEGQIGLQSLNTDN